MPMTWLHCHPGALEECFSSEKLNLRKKVTFALFFSILNFFFFLEALNIVPFTLLLSIIFISDAGIKII